jgi:hypothetical protein
MIIRVSTAFAAMLLTTTALAGPTDVAAPAGATLLLAAAAEGVQIYRCDPKDSGFSWVFQAPEAALFDSEGRQVLAHFAGPSWKQPDGTTLVGEVVAKADAPIPHAVPWLLLKAKSHEGDGQLAKADFIRRVDTKEGTAPTAGCDAAHAGQEARMRYSAIYEFYQGGK